jgi:hypothetical protein
MQDGIKLDHARLEALTLFSDDELREIVDGVVASVADVRREIDAGMTVGDLAAVAQAAHRGRNEALLVGARELDAAFAAIEAAARHGRSADVHAGVATVADLWPPTSSAIGRIPHDLQP